MRWRLKSRRLSSDVLLSDAIVQLFPEPPLGIATFWRRTLLEGDGSCEGKYSSFGGPIKTHLRKNFLSAEFYLLRRCAVGILRNIRKSFGVIPEKVIYFNDIVLSGVAAKERMCL
jgi:hypothetical protein